MIGLRFPQNIHSDVYFGEIHVFSMVLCSSFVRIVMSEYSNE